MNIEDKSVLKAIALMLLLTIALLLLQKYSLNRSLVFDGASDRPIYPIYDQMSGGESTAQLGREENLLVLDCEIVDAYAWPYCEVNIDLRQADDDGKVSGVNLSRYDRVGLWARYENDQQSGIRFHLRNFNPAYSNNENPDSLKYNVLEFHEFNSEYPLWVSLESFQVATWWLVEHRIPFQHMATELTNVMQLELATGSGIAPGHHRLIVERIEFQGKIIRKEQIYLIIALLWIIAALMYVLRWFIAFRLELSRNRFRQGELEAVNRVLNIKSQQLEDKASRDPLTGALNREGLQKLFYEGLAQTNTASGLCIIFMDIDHFKSINDTHGHNFGDNILKEFAALVTENTRNADVLARWGGEEFILACPNSILNDAYILAEKLRVKIMDHKWPAEITMTCCFGVAKMTEETFEAFIHRADSALYKAKAQGRNKVVTSES